MIVVDSSALVDALVGSPSKTQLLDLVSTEDLHVPDLTDFEVASALRGLLLAGKLPPTRAREALEDFASLQLERHRMTAMLGEVLRLRGNFTAYDASYVVLAKLLRVPLVTCDGKLLEARRIGVEVRTFRPDAHPE